MNGNISRKLLFLFIHFLFLLNLALSAPKNIFEKSTLQIGNNLNPKDDDDEDCNSGEREEECPEKCDEFSEMCGRRFWTIFSVIIGVSILAIVTIIVAIVICVYKVKKSNKLKATRRSERLAAPKQITPQVEVTPPSSSFPEVEPGNSNNKSNTNQEIPTAPLEADYENTRHPTRVDEPPPPYDFIESRNSSIFENPGASTFRLKGKEAKTS
ncbi:unnamed protein product [Allacma fusca]|uniref:Uncharacterized protein n=1 Tax=Allacma fusca TaxID=39272 RepID=A0A8J2NKP9_9HEXA|nr:unnamed protein product [Allacma fusca]